ncbi:FtsX-like permease family protein [Clostridium sp.]|uniref:ABC transporter permease n=1 Tax=Clostridium sp. TaxID=1506 RepID=UPI003D6D851C
MEEMKFLRKSIVGNKIQIISISILIASVAFLFNYLYLGVVYVQNNYDYLIADSNRSDCSFIPKLNISKAGIMELAQEYSIDQQDLHKDFYQLVDKYNISLNKYYKSEMEDLSSKYNFKYEKYTYKVLKEDGKTYFITAYSGNINRVIGKDQKLDVGHAYVTNIESFYNDNKLTIRDKKYSIVGNYTSVDAMQLYSMKNSSNNLTKNNIGVFLSVEEYRSLDVDEEFHYLLSFEDAKDKVSFEKYAIDNSTYYSDTIDYLKNIEDAIQMNLKLAYVALIAYIFVTLIIFYITLKNLLDSLDKDIGLLKVVGVSRWKISASVTIIYVVLGIVGLLIGNILGKMNIYMIRNQFAQLYNIIYLKKASFNSEIFLFSIFILGFIIMVVGYLTLKKAGTKTLILLKSESLSKNSVVLRLSKTITKKLPLTYAIKTAFALKKINRVLIIVIGVLLASIFLAMGIGLYAKQYTEVSELNSSAKYEKLYYFDKLQYSTDKNVSYQSEANIVSNSNKETIELMGLNIDGDIFTKSIYENLDDDKIVISKILAKRNNINVGDRIKLLLKGKEKEVQVQMILDSNYDSRCYINLGTLYHYWIQADSYNVYYEKEDGVKISQDILDKALRVETLSEYQDNNLNNFSQILMIVGIILAFSVIIVILVFSLIASLNIHDSLKDIKIMQFLGYKRNKIFSSVVSTYLLVIILTLCGGYFVFPHICLSFENMMNVSNWKFYIGIDSSWKVYLAGSVFIISNYYIWMLAIYSTKIQKKKVDA